MSNSSVNYSCSGRNNEMDMRSTDCPRGTLRLLIGRMGLILIVGLLMITALGCYNIRTGRVDVGGEINFKLPAFPQTGGHAVEAFTEMHFQPSYRVQEGPRILPPEGSVPITGREVEYDTVEDYEALEIPAHISSDAQAISRAQHIYDANCQVCHGSDFRGEDGDAPILPYLDPTDLRPKNLVDERLDGDGNPIKGAANSTDGEIYAWITYGGQSGFALALRDRPTTSWMPPFGRLLTEDERWELVMLIRAEQNR